MCYLNRFLVDLVVLGVLEIPDHQVDHQYHPVLDHLVDLQPIKEETLTQGSCFWSAT